MFDLEARQSMQQGGGGQRFGHENQLWSNEPSEGMLSITTLSYELYG